MTTYDVKKALVKICMMIESLALDCEQHLKEQHKQTENDQPRFFFHNIAIQTKELRDDIDLRGL